MKAVLFDLDGTLADTAPDLANALNHVLSTHNRSELTFEEIRPVVSHGGIALIRLGFNIEPEHPEFEPLRLQLLDFYKDHICDDSGLFPGIDELLDKLDQKAIAWGIVTNKPDWLTQPLLEKLNLSHRIASLVCGNTLAEKKPHPAPLFYACQEMNITADQCIYIGDAARDIEAGKRAAMKTIAAAYGYIEDHDPADQWNADYLVTESKQLWPLLSRLLTWN
jgi:phosphoglycolate phosphatase